MRRLFLLLLLVLAASVGVPSVRADISIGFNLIGTDATNTAYTFGPGIAAFETVPAPQGNSGLYQCRLTVVECQQTSNGVLRAVSGIFFGSYNSNNVFAPVDLTTLPGNVICDVWTNGMAGFTAKPHSPDLEFDAGSTTNLTAAGTITNSATGTVYPLYRARADLTSVPVFLLNAGANYAFSLRLRYASVNAVTTRLAQSANTNGLGGSAIVLGGGYSGPDTGTNIATVPLAALAYEFAPLTPPSLNLQMISASEYRLSLPGDPAPFMFLRFESATNLNSPVDWAPIPGFGIPPAATGSLSGAEMFFRSVFQ